MKKFSCFGKNDTEVGSDYHEEDPWPSPKSASRKATQDSSPSKSNTSSSDADVDAHNISSSCNATHNSSSSESNPSGSVPKDNTNDARRNAILYSYRELLYATNHFSPESRIGEGVHVSTDQMISVKQLNPDDNLQEFITEVLMLSHLRHPNLVDFIGFCADEDQRMLVNEFLPLRSLHYHLHESTSEVLPLDWSTRMRIAYGVAKALDYLHDEAYPYPIIHMDLKSDNVLLGENFHPKIADFGLTKLGSNDDRQHGSNRVMSTIGYCAPEYSQAENLTFKTDVYSFGVLMLELITGKVAYDESRGYGKRSLARWVGYTLKGNWDPVLVIDKRLVGQYREDILRRATKMALMCVGRIEWRPRMADVVNTLLGYINETGSKVDI